MLQILRPSRALEVVLESAHAILSKAHGLLEPKIHKRPYNNLDLCTSTTKI